MTVYDQQQSGPNANNDDATEPLNSSSNNNNTPTIRAATAKVKAAAGGHAEIDEEACSTDASVPMSRRAIGMQVGVINVDAIEGRRMTHWGGLPLSANEWCWVNTNRVQ